MTELNPTDVDARTDADLVRLAAAGDMDAFAALYEQYHPLAFATTRRFLDLDAAEDAAHEVFIWLAQGRWRVMPGFQGRLYPFVSSLARFAAWKVGYRPLVMRNSKSLDDWPDEIPHQTQLNPEQILLRKERYQLLRAALRKLPPLPREVAMLRFGHGLMVADIAARLTAPDLYGRCRPRTKGAVEHYLKDIREHLRRELSDVYHLPTPDCARRWRRADA